MFLEKKMPNTNTVNTPNTKKGDSVTEWASGVYFREKLVNGLFQFKRFLFWLPCCRITPMNELKWLIGLIYFDLGEDLGWMILYRYGCIWRTYRHQQNEPNVWATKIRMRGTVDDIHSLHQPLVIKYLCGTVKTKKTKEALVWECI